MPISRNAKFAGSNLWRTRALKPLAGLLGAIGSMSAIATAASAQPAPCTDFAAYHAGDTIPSGDRVGYFWVSAVPAAPIEIRDAVPVGRPAHAVGALIRQKLAFSTGDDFFRSADIRFVSLGRGVIRLRILRGSAMLRTVTLPRAPAGTLRTVAYSGFYANGVSFAEASGRSVVVGVCAAR